MDTPDIRFLKATIKIQHPEWSESQVLAEIEKIKNASNDDGCLSCSG